MTPTLRSPASLLFSLFIIFTLAVGASAAPRGKKGKPAPAKAAKAAKNTRAAKGRQQQQQAAAKKPSRNETRAERRARARDERAATPKGGKLARRAQLAAARREAEERRRRAEAARRAELARLAAIARQRALDEALRSEVQANILKDDATGEDPEVRRAAVQALGYHAGTVVVMNPKTGQIYTIVNQEWAVRRGFKPCSTTKLITGLAGLGEGVIDPVFENVSYNNHPTLTSALARSAPNSYFQQVGRKVGFERMVSYARQLGLGERTGINHVNEFPGRLPLFKNDVGMLRMSSHGDDIEVTNVQLAALASVFATGGTLVTPHLPRTPEEALKFKTEVRRQLNIPQENLRRMLVGMVGAVNYGSGRKAHNPEQTIAGKTGTCIGAGGVWVGLFTSFAPVEDPQLAVAVIGRGTDARKGFPVTVANQIYRALSHRFGSRNGRAPYQFTPPTVMPKLPVDAIADEEADDVDDEAREAMKGATNVMTPTEGSNNGVKPILMSVPQQQQHPAPTPEQRSAQPAPAQPRPSVGDDRPRRVNSERPPQ